MRRLIAVSAIAVIAASACSKSEAPDDSAATGSAQVTGNKVVASDGQGNTVEVNNGKVKVQAGGTKVEVNKGKANVKTATDDKKKPADKKVDVKIDKDKVKTGNVEVNKDGVKAPGVVINKKGIQAPGVKVNVNGM